MRRRSLRKTCEVSPIARLWILRTMVALGVDKSLFRDTAVLESIGLGDWTDQMESDDDLGEFETYRKVDRKSLIAALHTAHREAEKEAHNTFMPDLLKANLESLAQLAALSEIDQTVLGFAIMAMQDSVLETVLDSLGSNLSSLRVVHALSVILAIPEEKIRASLSVKSTLSYSGLLSLDRDGTTYLRCRLDLLSKSFAGSMCCAQTEPLSLLRGTVNATLPARLSVADYRHIQSTLETLFPFLSEATHTQRVGTNIFIHGAPGTGKSELARLLARECGYELFEIASEDEDGDPINGESRLRALRVAQCFFKQRKALLLFDEVEDVFNDGTLFSGKSTAQKHKAWLNRMLEENAVPTIWLSNTGHGIDPAFIRRFDMVFELPVPNRMQREQIARDICHDLLDETDIKRIADSQDLTPAVLAKAAQVVRTIHRQLPSPDRGRTLVRLINDTLQAQGHVLIKANDPNRLPEVYDPAFIHADVDLGAISEGLQQSRSGRICLFGPPGTGKTAYGRWLAEQLGMPLMVKRVSDLESPWVGQCEKNIARAFREAEQEGALLLIDEVDSFLQDRREATRSWEVTRVNEMLTQMESFSGVFIASTNLMGNLDQASLRRFDLKVKFDYLKPSQATELLRRYCAQLRLKKPSPEETQALSRLQNLTPGDFTAVLRQNRFRQFSKTNELIAALHAECALKEKAHTPIGFLK